MSRPIPTCRFPKATTIIALVVVAFAAAVLLSGCKNSDLNDRPFEPYIYQDKQTGCEYVSPSGMNGIYPRIDKNGKQVCR